MTALRQAQPEETDFNEYTESTNPEFHEAPKRLMAIKFVGSGMESNVFRVRDEIADATSEVLDSDQVAKTKSWKAIFWRGNRTEIYPACLEALDKRDIPYIQTEIYDRVVLIFDNGTEEEFKTVLISPYVDNLEELTINYAQLLDKETGIATQLEIVGIIEKAQVVAEEEGLGLDAFGLNTMFKIFKTYPRALFSKVINLKGKDIQISNLIRDPRAIENNDEETVKLIDIGLLDMRKRGGLMGIPRRMLAQIFYELTMVGLIETMRRANIDFAEQHNCEPNTDIERRLSAINQRKIDNASKFNPSHKLYQGFANKLIKLLSPVLIKYIEDTPKRKAKATRKKEQQQEKEAARHEKITALKEAVHSIQDKINNLIERNGVKFKQDILPLIKRQCKLETKLALYSA